MINQAISIKIKNLYEEKHEQIINMILKVNNLAHSIGDEDKCMKTLLKELSRLFDGLKILNRNGMPILYDDIESLLPIDIVKYLVTTYGVGNKLFED